MSEDPKRDADVKLVSDICDQLIEHFDTVQIFCTRHESGERDGTTHISRGNGNWFARYGQIKDWVTTEEQLSREKVIDRQP